MSSPALVAISAIDFAAAILLVWHFPGGIMLAVGLILLAKGIWSAVSSFAEGFYWDMFGFLDFAAALVIIVLNFGTGIGFAWIFGILMAAKATYTLLSSI